MQCRRCLFCSGKCTLARFRRGLIVALTYPRRRMLKQEAACTFSAINIERRDAICHTPPIGCGLQSALQCEEAICLATYELPRAHLRKPAVDLRKMAVAAPLGEQCLNSD